MKPRRPEQDAPHAIVGPGVQLGLALCLLTVVGSVLAQGNAGSSLPATATTSSVPSRGAPSGLIAASSAGLGASRSQKAQVTFVDGLLNVRADNSSLNGILREISRTTGMKLTGGVAEQRVFGNYGPAAPGTVLATLLDGTGSNMLLRETADAGPTELILTPRTGGPSPPSPSNYTADDEDASTNPPAGRIDPALGGADPAVYGRHGSIGAGLPMPVGTSGPRSLGQPMNNVNGSPLNTSPTAATYPTTNSVPLDAIPTPSTTPAVSGIVDAPNPSPAGTTTSTPSGIASGQTVGNDGSGGTENMVPQAATTPGSAMATGSTPAGPTTPEQVYQLLQQLRQQSQQQQGGKQ